MTLVGFMFYQPKTYTSVQTGSTLAEIGAAGLVRTVWNAQINQPDTTLDDIWARDMMNVVQPRNGEIQVPTNDILFQVPTSSYANTIICQAARPLQEAPQMGEANRMINHEEQIRALFTSMRYNITQKAVSVLGYGPAFEDIDATGLYKNVSPAFKKFWTEMRGLDFRKAGMLEVCDHLTYAPTSLVQQFCKNVFVCNIAEDDQPAYDTTALTTTQGAADSIGFYSSRTFSGVSTFVESIAAKMVEGAGLISSPVAYLDVAELDRLDTWLTNIVMMPKVKIGSEWGYRVDLNPWQYDRLSSLASGMGDYFKYQNTFVKADGKLSYPGLLGMYKNLFLFRDSRGATLTLTGSEGSYALKPGWVNPGGNDDRNKSAWSVASGALNLVFDVAMVYGASGLCERVVKPIQYVNESQEYGYLQGRGSYAMNGKFTVKWDTDSNGLGVNFIQRSVAMVISSRKSVAALRATT
jgi:hypothetical protein